MSAMTGRKCWARRRLSIEGVGGTGCLSGKLGVRSTISSAQTGQVVSERLHWDPIPRLLKALLGSFVSNSQVDLWSTVSHA